jgi:hypothetical protein
VRLQVRETAAISDSQWLCTTAVSRVVAGCGRHARTAAKGLQPQFLAQYHRLYVRCAKEYVRETVLLGEAATQPLAQR